MLFDFLGLYPCYGHKILTYPVHVTRVATAHGCLVQQYLKYTVQFKTNCFQQVVGHRGLIPGFTVPQRM